MFENIIAEIIQNLFKIDVKVKLERPDPKFGDLATNIAMQLAAKLQQPPRQIAEQLAKELRKQADFKQIDIAGAGFINFWLSDTAILQLWRQPINKYYQRQTVVVEYSDPNPFKVLHAGHFYTSVVGDAIANLVKIAGGNIKRANFGGDVGLHVAKTLWAIRQDLGDELPDKLKNIPNENRADWLAKNYVIGTKAYEDDTNAKAEITAINKQVYDFHNQNDHASPLAQIYWTTREWSYDYFKQFYARIGSHFDKFYPESMTAERGLEEVKKQIGTVFEKSDGAVIFPGEKYNLHTRVFINKAGLPTYEAKDVGLIFIKNDDWHFDKSIIITADEQKQYMQVVLKAIEQFAPNLAQATTHITHGIVKLAGGVKMSSRKGNFLRAIDILEYANQANLAQNQVKNEDIALGAIKYAFLKNRLGGDIIYDPIESVSLIGNSGPYLQYAHARACSILAKAGQFEFKINDLDDLERPLALKLADFTPTINQASQELLPHLICTYLYELAQEFNRFYEKAPIIGNERQQARLTLVKKYQNTLKQGLELLGIKALEQM